MGAKLVAVFSPSGWSSIMIPIPIRTHTPGGDPMSVSITHQLEVFHGVAIDEDQVGMGAFFHHSKR